MREHEIRRYIHIGIGLFGLLVVVTLIGRFSGGDGGAGFSPDLQAANIENLTYTRGQGCEIPEIPDNAFVQLIGVRKTSLQAPLEIAYRGRAEGTGLVNVVVTRNDRPVFLVLSSHNQVLWNIQKADDAQIAGVLVTGYHAQAVANLPFDVSPSFFVVDDPERRSQDCLRLAYPVQKGEPFEILKEQMTANFGRGPDDFMFPSKAGTIRVGPDRPGVVEAKPIDASTIYSPTPVVDGRDTSRDAKLKSLVDDGSLMRFPAAKLAELKKVIKRYAPETNVRRLFSQKSSGDQMIVVTEQVILPAGMSGSNSATVLIPDGVELPYAPKNQNQFIKLPIGLNDFIHLM